MLESGSDLAETSGLVEFSPLTTQIDPGGLWGACLFVGLSIAVLRLTFGLPRRLPWQLVIFTAWALIHALFILEYPLASFGKMHRAYQASAGQFVAEYVLIGIFAINCSKSILRFVPYVAALEIMGLLTLGYGLLYRESFDLAFLSLCLPFIPWWLAIPAIALILTHHAISACAIFGVQILVYYRRAWVALPLAGLAVIAWFQHPHGQERLDAWIRFMGYWAQSWKTVMFGVGPGSFMWTSLIIDDFKMPMYIMMHCDWLQICFETGILGAALIAAACWKGVQTKDRKIAAALAGAAVFGLAWHPARMFPTAIVIASILVESFN